MHHLPVEVVEFEDIGDGVLRRTKAILWLSKAASHAGQDAGVEGRALPLLDELVKAGEAGKSLVSAYQRRAHAAGCAVAG